MSIDLSRLKANFAPDEIEWRVQQSGKKGEGAWALVLAYITNRAIMDRLDEVCGPENWRNEYARAPEGGILCGISIRLDGEWITKWDGAENTDIEAVKGGLSNAMKRAAVQWGIGRYLYELEASFVKVTEKAAGKHSKRVDDTKKGVRGFWDPPSLPGWAMPEKAAPAPTHARTPTTPTPPGDPREKQRPAYIAKIIALADQLGADTAQGITLAVDSLSTVSMDTLASIGAQLKDALENYGEQTDDTTDQPAERVA